MRNVLIQIKGVTFFVSHEGEQITSVLLDGVEVMPIIANDWLHEISYEVRSHISDRASRLEYSHDDCF